jgi:hypothetical protein
MLRALPLLAALLGLPLVATSARAQPDPAEAPAAFTNGIGASVLLTNHGFGLGGLVRFGVAEHTSLVLEASVGSGKDEREQEFFVGPFGETVVLFKRHYFLMLPLTAGFEQRLWAETIEDDFRPFFQATAGPVLGYQWPYFDDLDGDGVRDPGEPKRSPFNLRGGEFRLGAGGVLAFGAYLGESRRNTFGLRIGYAAQYFPVPVELLEPRPEIEAPERRFFGTPVFSLHLLRR